MRQPCIRLWFGRIDIAVPAIMIVAHQCLNSNSLKKAWKGFRVLVMQSLTTLGSQHGTRIPTILGTPFSAESAARRPHWDRKKSLKQNRCHWHCALDWKVGVLRKNIMFSTVSSQVIKLEVHLLTWRIHAWRVSAGENSSAVFGELGIFHIIPLFGFQHFLLPVPFDFAEACFDGPCRVASVA